MTVKETINWQSENGENHSGCVIHQCEEDISVIACDNCGFNHVVPLPDDAALEAFYNEEFYANEKPDYLSSSDKDYAWLKLSFGDRFNLFEKTLNIKSGKVLDIGCGPGSFLEEGKNRGWQVFGVEPSRQASAFANEKGLNVIHGAFKASLFANEEPFDVIHMSEVLEHVAHPKEIIEGAAKLLKTGGLMCISVPNDFNGFQQSLVASGNYKPWWVVPDHHLNYFNFATLEKLMENNGLEVSNRTTNFPMELFLLMGHNYTTDPKLGSELHEARKKFDLSLAENGGQQSRLGFYNALANAGLGRLAIITAQKK